MAILSIEEQWDQMTISESSDQGYTGTRHFIVVTDETNISPALILQDSRLPALGSPFPGSLTVFLTERVPSRVGDSREVWLVTCSYSSQLSQEQRERANQPNPLQRKASIEWISKPTMQVVTKCLQSVSAYGKVQFYTDFLPAYGENSAFAVMADVNSAGDYTEPAMEIMKVEWIARIRKNVDQIPQWFITYEDAVNNADFNLAFYGSTLTIPKGCGKLGAITLPVQRQENGVEYVQLQYDIHVRVPRPTRGIETEAPSPWDIEVLDAGMRKREWDPDAGPETVTKWANVLDNAESPVMTPVPFDGSGDELKETKDGRIPEDQLKWRLIRVYPRKDFSVLPIT
jgi:hypothetical protein